MGVRKLMDFPDQYLKGRRLYGFFHTFDHYVTGDRFTSILTDAGTIAAIDAKGGGVNLTPSDGTVADNDEAYLHTTRELFLFDDDQPIMIEAMLQFAEANVDDVNILFSLLNAPAANALQDNGGGPPASYSGAGFHKVDGGTKWIVESSVAGVQQTTTTDVTAGGSSFVKLRVEVQTGRASGKVDVVYFINDQQCRDANGAPIKHEEVAVGSATEMGVTFGIKNGDITNVENLKVKWLAAYQLLTDI